MKILMVCLGNICRSPLAEGIMREKVHSHGLDWEVDSAGTSAWHIGEPPDSRSIDTAKQHGVDISAQRARQLKPADLDRFDLIFAMDSSNYQDILQLAQNDEQRSKVKMILNEVDPGKNFNVPDPYWDNNGFESVFQMLDVACERVVKKLG